LAEEAKERATAKVVELEAQLAAADAELQPKRNAVVAARETLLRPRLHASRQPRQRGTLSAP
jgi:hypothetical protein